MTISKKTAAIVFSAIASLAANAPAIAAPATSTVSVEVTYSDLNLNSQAGVETLNRRIDAAAQQVCERSWDRGTRTAAHFSDIQSCLVETRANIDTQIKQNRELATAVLGLGDTMMSDISE
ncbi:MAG: UrcA family protein [Pseudomonadota bacterium]